MRPASVWVIGGSDSSGGAGIQADLATLQDLAVSSCTLVSAITGQSHQRLIKVVPSSIKTLQAQWDGALDTALPAVIKIGLLCNREQVLWLANQLKTLTKRPWIILDPVLESSSGGSLVEAGTIKAIADNLLPMVSLVTPNVPECQALFGTTNAGEAVTCLQALASQPTKTHLLIKGGHSLGRNQGAGCSMTDRLVGPLLNARLVGRKVATTKVRGTGCTLASAIAAFFVHMLQQQRPQPVCVKEALVLAKAYLQQGLDQARLNQDNLSAGGGYEYISCGPCLKTGWPEKPQSFPVLEGIDTCEAEVVRQQAKFNPVPWLKPDCVEVLRNQSILYPILSSLDHLELCLKYQVPIVQLRLKTGSTAYRLQKIRTAIKMAKGTQTSLYINDEWRWALEEGAFGVHLGQKDLMTAPLALIQRVGLALGVSTHGYWELLAAINLHPSYIAIGSIFSTKTKDMSGYIQGVEHLRRLASICTYGNIPCVAIGGIQLHNLSSVLRTQINAVAVVSAITQAPDPAQALQHWQERLALEGLWREGEALHGQLQSAAFNPTQETVL